MNCLDAETLAAWMDGGLAGAALEDVRLHVADCARCQTLVGALGRTRAAVPMQEPERARRWWLAWAVPVTAAATAALLWVAVPRQDTPPAVSAVPAERSAQAVAPPAAAPSVPPPSVTPPPAVAEKKETALTDARARAAAPQPPQNARAEADVREQGTFSAGALAAPPAAEPPAPATATAQTARDAAREAAPPAAAPSAPAAGNVLAQKAALAPLCGATWSAPPPSEAGELAASSMPSAVVCWVVGRAGLVLRSTDGRTWQRLPFPEMTDLSAVRATDGRVASVSTSDGRTFMTADGGQTWARQ